MWAYYVTERKGRTPTGAELDQMDGTNNYGRRVLRRWKDAGRIGGGGVLKWDTAQASRALSVLVRFLEPNGAVLVTDGGLATELDARGHDLSDPLWSARLLVDAPEGIKAAHLAFFRAGAVIATTASYQASFDGFAAQGSGRLDAARLLRRSVELARAARGRAGNRQLRHTRTR
jgi:hypothetical protein